jgi:hypothetical protein
MLRRCCRSAVATVAFYSLVTINFESASLGQNSVPSQVVSGRAEDPTPVVNGNTPVIRTDRDTGHNERAVFNKYCVGCHNDSLKAGG